MAATRPVYPAPSHSSRIWQRRSTIVGGLEVAVPAQDATVLVTVATVSVAALEPTPVVMGTPPEATVPTIAALAPTPVVVGTPPEATVTAAAPTPTPVVVGTPPEATVTSAALAPTPVVIGTPPAATISVAGVVPSFVGDPNAFIEVPAATVTTTAPVPTPVVMGTPPAATVTSEALAPTPVVIVIPDQATITVAGPVPAFVGPVGANATVLVEVATVTLTAPTPTPVVVGTPPAATVTTTAPAPTPVVMGTPPAATVTSAGLAPTPWIVARPPAARVTVGELLGYDSQVLSLSPLAYYRLGESSGLTAVDETGSHNGTYTDTGSPGYGQAGALTGDSDTAFYFEGDSVTIPNSLSIAAGSSITIEFWNYVGFGESNGGYTFTIGSQSAPSQCSASVPYSDHIIYWDYGDSTGGRVTADYTSYYDAWSLVHLTFDAGTDTHAISINGVEVASSVDSTAPTSTLTGGAIASWFGIFHWGAIDEFAVYDYALTEAERLANYQVGTVTRAGAIPVPTPVVMGTPPAATTTSAAVAPTPWIIVPTPTATVTVEGLPPQFDSEDAAKKILLLGTG